VQELSADVEDLALLLVRRNQLEIRTTGQSFMNPQARGADVTIDENFHTHASIIAGRTPCTPVQRFHKCRYRQIRPLLSSHLPC
jgi:hypothetical protein